MIVMEIVAVRRLFNSSRDAIVKRWVRKTAAVKSFNVLLYYDGKWWWEGEGRRLRIQISFNDKHKLWRSCTYVYEIRSLNFSLV
jgi:hypothetical protein